MKIIINILLFSISFHFCSCSTVGLEDNELTSLQDSISNVKNKIDSFSYSEDTVSSHLKRLELTQMFLNLKLKESNNYIEIAGNEFKIGYLSSLTGGTLTSVLVLSKKGEDVPFTYYIPALIGGVILIVNSINASFNLQDAGNILSK